MPILTDIFSFMNEPSIYVIKILLALLFFFIIYPILLKLPTNLREQKGIIAIIAFAIALIGAMAAREELIEKYLLLPYKVFGLLLILLIPCLLIAYTIHRTRMTGIGRKITLVLFGIIIGIMGIRQYSNLEPMQIKIYLGALALVLIALIFDKALHTILRKKHT